MQPSLKLSSVCFRCRSFELGQPESWLFNSTTVIQRRFRTGGQQRSKTRRDTSDGRDRSGSSSRSRYKPTYSIPQPYQFVGLYGNKKIARSQGGHSLSRSDSISNIPHESIPAFLEGYVTAWATDPRTLNRLTTFGFPHHESQRLLRAFISAVTSKSLTTPENFQKYSLERFTQPHSGNTFDVLFSSVFFSWAADPQNRSIVQTMVSETTLKSVINLVKAADRQYPAEEFDLARKIRRKVIMHVGPTNSGKTHHALRALAAAKVGVYAGPLRLLAHEIWERLNLGQIVPLGMDEDAEPPILPSTPVDAVAKSPAVLKQFNPRYARQCNMITGEEQKIVSLDAPLLSCTVEMLSTNREYDVAVIDEIQMIGDSDRGNGWTQAVLGMYAKELHLCGEETAIPIIQALIAETGDELVIKHYERLTPLKVEEKSLEGDLNKVRKGDCLVTFRRSNIFALKSEVERKTGMRCAVVYGRLPPEIRSEQAALFNDPNSGYDVIIGSDAIGMGLNLKIRRIIFSEVSKFNGKTEVPLAVSSVKQIAGRAGRYGMHGSSEAGGFVTTLNAKDLPFLRETLQIPYTPLSCAYMSPNRGTFTALTNVLPPSSSLETIYNAHMYISTLPLIFRYSEPPDLHEMSSYVDTFGGPMIAADRLFFTVVPFPWRDANYLPVMKQLLCLYRQKSCVTFKELLSGMQFLKTLSSIEALMETGVEPRSTADQLGVLEMFHKILVTYLWLSFRNNVVFPSYRDVSVIKARLEKALDWCLQGISKSKYLQQSPNIRQRRQSSRTQIPYSTRTSRQGEVENVVPHAVALRA